MLLGIVLKEAFLITLSAAIFAIIAVSWWWNKFAPAGVSYQRKFYYTRGFPDESFDVQIEVENKKLLPLSWVRIQDDWDRAVAPVDEAVLSPSHIQDRGYLINLYSMRWYEKIRRSYSLLLRKRGIFTIGPVHLDTGDLFGIFEQNLLIQPDQYLTVFPSLIPFARLNFPAEDPFGDRHSRQRIFEDPNRPMGIREYHPEDGFRRVHWPATARMGQLQVKVYQPTTGQIMMICLNVSTFSRHWEGIHTELLEYLISVAATLVNEGINQGYKVGLVANGCLAHADQPFRIPPGRSPQQLATILQALAGVTSVVTGNFETFLMKEIPKVQYGATLIILTSVVSPELAATILQLKKHERRITLFSLAPEPPPEISGIQIIHQPFDRTNSL